MSYREGIFIDRETERRALRDSTRDAFFAEIGIPRLKDPLSIDVDPAVQKAKVLELCGIARETHAGDLSGLDMLEAALGQLDFSIPLVGLKGLGALTLADVSLQTLQKSHFDMSWLGWFDD